MASLTSASSELATTTSIYSVASSALATQITTTSEFNGPASFTAPAAPTVLPPAAPTVSPPPAPTNSVGSGSSPSPIATGLTTGEKVGIAIGSAAVLAIFLWWFWPKRRKIKKRSDIPTSLAQDNIQSSVTTEIKRTDERHLSARVKTV